MKMQKRFGIANLTALLASFAAQVQRIPGGAERGAAGGPVGGAVWWLAASQEESAVCLASMKLPAFTTM